jgi:hypothetical protein
MVVSFFEWSASGGYDGRASGADDVVSREFHGKV